MFVRYVIALCVYDMRAVRARDGFTVVDAARVLFESLSAIWSFYACATSI